MSVSPDNVRVAITGAVSKGAYGATAPTSAISALTTYVDLGAISEDGVTETLPENGEATQIKIWQNGATVRTVRSTSDDLPSWSFTLVETSVATLETAYGVTLDDTDGSIEYVVQNRGSNSYVLDVVDGSHLRRSHIPKGTVKSVGEVKLANTEAIGYQITIEGELDPTTGYNFKSWYPDFVDEG